MHLPSGGAFWIVSVICSEVVAAAMHYHLAGIWWESHLLYIMRRVYSVAFDSDP